MFRYYGLASLTITAITVIAVNIVTWRGLEPYSNDLTRIGGFAEEAYGWRGVRENFPQPHLVYINPGSYDRYTDIVVLGDSFTHRPQSSSNWALHFANLSGLSIQFLHHEDGGIERILQTGLYQQQPPKVVIFQMIEHNLGKHFTGDPGTGNPGTCDTPSTDTPLPLPSDFAPMNIVPVEYTRNTTPQRGDYQRAIQYLRNSVMILTGRRDELDARITPLVTPHLFSNQKSDSLLYYAGDLHKQKWPEALAQRIACALAEIKQAVEANGKTAFVVLLVPDKLSAYSPWLADQNLAQLTILDAPELATFPHALNLHSRTIDAIEKGFIDFYTPSDTHWSSQGDLRVAQWLAQMFRQGERQ
jgi:hypothetical protein